MPTLGRAQPADGLDCRRTQKNELRQAFRELYGFTNGEDRRSYNNLALIHQNHCQHGWERFLPWHRVYLYEFEQALQDFCPRRDDAVVGLPEPQYHPDDPGSGAILPDAFKGFLTEASVVCDRSSWLPGQRRTGGQLRPLVDGKLCTVEDASSDVTAACGNGDYVRGREPRAADRRAARGQFAVVSAALFRPVRRRHHQHQDPLSLPDAGRPRRDPRPAHLPRFRRRQPLCRQLRLPRPESAQHHAHLDRRHEPGVQGRRAGRPQQGGARRRAQIPPARRSLFRAAVRRHVLQPDGVLRPDLLAGARQYRPAVVALAAGPSRRAAGRPRFGADAVELRGARHARHEPLRL